MLWKVQITRSVTDSMLLACVSSLNSVYGVLTWLKGCCWHVSACSRSPAATETCWGLRSPCTRSPCTAGQTTRTHTAAGWCWGRSGETWSLFPSGSRSWWMDRWKKTRWDIFRFSLDLRHKKNLNYTSNQEFSSSVVNECSILILRLETMGVGKASCVKLVQQWPNSSSLWSSSSLLNVKQNLARSPRLDPVHMNHKHE